MEIEPCKRTVVLADKGLEQHRDVQRNASAPFIHKIEVGGVKYVYDVNTNQILKVDHVVWDIVEDHGHLSKEQIVCKYNTKYEAAEISAAFDNISKV